MKQKHFVVIGGGITGMDAVSYLLTKKNEKICDG
jgi:NADPH-dependent glutamate synthase beta subunit-like oxidoreductase